MDYCENCKWFEKQPNIACASCKLKNDVFTNFEMKGVKIPIQNMNFDDKPEMETIQPLDKYKKIGESIGSLVDEKNRAYGDSFNKAGDFLKLLYPNGVQPDQYGDMLGLVRVFDKLMRIATDKDALGENPWRDIGGYAILKSDDE